MTLRILCRDVLASGHQFYNVGIVASGKSTVGGNDNDRFFRPTLTLLEIRVIASCLTSPAWKSLSRYIYWKYGFVCSARSLGFLQLYGRHQLHGFGDLLRYSGILLFTSFNVSHRGHNITPPICRLL